MTANASTKVFDIINERILARLNEGVVPWRKPWSGPAYHPRSIDGRPYGGINAFLLGSLGFEDPRFATFKRINQLGGRVAKGQKGFPVVYWQRRTRTETDPNTGEEREVTRPVLLYFTVFNVAAQTTGVALKPLALGVAPDPVEAAESIVAGMPNPPLIGWNGGDRAYYTPALDAINIPARRQFGTAVGYYETLFHELGHSTGHETRLNRQGIAGFDHFGSERYAREELVAEFTAAFLMGEAGIESGAIDNVAAYIDGWKRRIAEDPRCLVVAAGAAQRAANHILGRSYDDEHESEVATPTVEAVAA